MRPLDRQLGRITWFEKKYIQTFRHYYVKGHPLDRRDSQYYIKRFADELGVNPPKLNSTKKNNPWAFVWGARPSIYLRADHRHPYLLAHEVAHVATRTIKHPPVFVEAYATALSILGESKGSVEHQMRRFGIRLP